MYGRTHELEKLNERYNEYEKACIIVTGVSGMGKTTLIQEFLKDKQDYLYFSVAEASSDMALKRFSYEITRHFGLKERTEYKHFSQYMSWNEAFDDICSLTAGKKFILVLDNYDDLLMHDEKPRKLTKSIAELYMSAGSIFIILCGKDVRLMHDVMHKIGDAIKQSFYGFRDMFELLEMPFDETLPFLEGLSNTDKMKYLTILGGNPGHLKLIDKSRSFEDNLKDMFFSEYESCLKLPYSVYPSKTKDPEKNNLILEAITHGCIRNKDITAAIHESSASAVSVYLSILEEQCLVTKHQCAWSVFSYYTVTDPFVRFWFTFVYNKESGFTSTGESAYNDAKARIEDYLEMQSERVIVSYVYRHYLKNNPYEIGLFFRRISGGESEGQLWLSSTWVNMSNQAAYIIISHDKQPYSKEMLLNEYCYYKEYPGRSVCDYYIYSPSGYAPDLEPEEGIHLLTLDDIFNF